MTTRRDTHFLVIVKHEEGVEEVMCICKKECALMIKRDQQLFKKMNEKTNTMVVEGQVFEVDRWADNAH